MRYPGFVGGSYTSQSLTADAERTVNWYPEQIESGSGKAAVVLYPAPGFELLCTLPTAPYRGGYTLNGRTFAVGGGSLYELTVLGSGVDVTVTATLRASGLSNPDDAPVSMASNGDAGFQLMIASGSTLYCFDLRLLTLTQVLTGVSQVGFVDGFFVALNPAESAFYISALEDGSTWDATQKAQRSDAADKWRALLVAHKELWLFGSPTTSVWYDAGLAPFPFTANPSVFVQSALAAPYAAALLDDAPIWLGTNDAGGAMVYRAEGYVPRRVSNHALENALLDYDISTAEAFVYQEAGHSFYVLNFPGVACWVYDAVTGAWHERGDHDGVNYTGLPVRGHLFVSGAHLVGSRTTGAIYRMGIDLAVTVGGAGLRRLRRAPHVASGGDRIVIDRVRVDVEAATALTTGQGSDPVCYMAMSGDGGHTFGSARPASLGKVGEYRARCEWWRWGQTRDAVFEFTCSEPIAIRLIDAFLEVRQ